MDHNTLKTVMCVSDALMYELYFDDNSEDDEDVVEKIWNFAEVTVPRMSHKQFQSHFRLGIETFEELLLQCQSVTPRTQLTSGNQKVERTKEVMICIWYLANLESFRSVADRFGVTKSTAWQSFYRVCDVLLTVNTQLKVISWPEGDRIQQIKRGFLAKGGFPDVIGAIDGSHIPICAPKESPNSYINRKGFHSVLLQAVCDDSMLFTDCYAGQAGSIHDACMFRRSDLQSRLPHIMQRGDHLVGDSAYTLKPTMMVPYKQYGALTLQQKNFNTRHAKTRVIIEQAFALLKGRFRRLKLLETVRMDLIAITVICGCILHNICLLKGDDFQDEINLENELAEERLMNGNNDFQNEEVAAADGIRKRNNIANNLPLVMNH